MKATMTKVNAEFYVGSYKGVKFEIVRVEGHKNWYWLVNGKGGEDWFPSKSVALMAVKDWIDNDYNRVLNSKIEN